MSLAMEVGEPHCFLVSNFISKENIAVSRVNHTYFLNVILGKSFTISEHGVISLEK